MNTLVKITKNNQTLAAYKGTSSHLFYDNWLPAVLLDLLKNLDVNTGNVAVDDLKYLALDPEPFDDDVTVIDLDKKTLALPKGFFLIVKPEDVTEANEFYNVAKADGKWVLHNAEANESLGIMDPVNVDYLEEKTNKEFPLDKAVDILTSMLEDADGYKRPTLLQNGMVYVGNIA